jgi:hypothetical protein
LKRRVGSEGRNQANSSNIIPLVYGIAGHGNIVDTRIRCFIDYDLWSIGYSIFYTVGI